MTGHAQPMNWADPPVVDDDRARVIVHTRCVDRGQRWIYNLWVVDSQQWTGWLEHNEAIAVLDANGYRDTRCRSKLRDARNRAIARRTAS